MGLWAAADDLPDLTSRTTKPGGATFPGTRTSRPVAARVTVHAPDIAVTARIPALSATYASVQPLPDGQVLVVSPRCRWRPEGPERNATVYDFTGAVLLEGTLGDGIGHVRTTGRGEIWVGYFDEGVYGNFGWGETESPPPLGASGLTRFSAAMTSEWHFPAHGENDWSPIDDCYALNVDGDTVWACYYSDFPIVRIHNDTVTAWHNDVRGAKAIAADGSRIALYGGYGSDRNRLVAGVLSGDRLHVTGEYRLVQPGGEPLPAGVQVVGRGPDLHILVGDEWLRLGLEDIPLERSR
ncbi:hypothetical protein [Amycolatopsis alba]|uniref:Uncharacterized protein n=1 Tax=Amycolatopsis alba DSM 44262 TaxID=1125972 RepID=A0A229RS44_AMYAL|nr:hypothetical protein [Amycolatopsis alba]OXM49493.1 hypothetical protein CFP75_19080 [Amycolatopsis alba DSM 44262]